MKLLRLDLRAFGPFTDMSLDLAAGQEGLHILYGPNEAGKSSALRGLRQLFFGIPVQCPDAHVHPYKNLRIQAKVQHSDGAVLEVIRRKASSNSLRDADDVAVVSNEALQRFLGGVDEKLFKTMFGIDHAALIAGGEEIVEGGGHFGEILFAASAGLPGLRRVQETLAQETKELFLSSGSNPRINRLIHEFNEAKKSLKDCQLSHEEWSRHAKSFETATEQKAKWLSEQQDLNRMLARCKRIGNALKAIAERKQILQDLEAHRAAVRLRDEFADERRQAEADLRSATQAADDAHRAAAELEAQLQGLSVPEPLLDQSMRVDDIYRRLGAHQKNLEDRPTREIQRKTHEHDAKEILRLLGKPPDLAHAEPLRLSLEESRNIQNLGNQRQGLAANFENARKMVDTLEARIADARMELEQTPEPPDTTDVRRAIQTALRLGEPERDLAAQEAALAAAEKRASMDLARLPHWSGSLDDLEKLPMLAEESLQEFETAQAKFTQEKTRLDQRRQDAETKLQSLEEQIRRLEAQQDVPTQENLTAARAKRNLAWNFVRRAWLENADDQVATNGLIGELAPGRGLAEAYERSVDRADDVVDRLRRDADRVAQYANFLSQRDALRSQFTDLSQKEKDLNDRLAATKQDWLRELNDCGMPALRLAEVRGWLQAQAKFVANANEVRTQRARITQLRQSIESACERLRFSIKALSEPDSTPPRALGVLLDHCQELVQRCDSHRNRRSKLAENWETHTKDLRAVQADVRTAEAKLAEWQRQWTPLMARINLGPSAAPSTANDYLAAIMQLFKELSDADVLRRRIDGMDRDMRKFAEDVQALSAKTCPDLETADAEELAVELHTRLNRARTAFQDRKNLAERLSTESEKLKKADASRRAATTRLEALCQEAGLRSVADLPQAEQRSRTRNELEKNLRVVEAQIRQFSAGATVDEMVAEAQQMDADSLGSEIERLEERLKALQQEISKLDQTIGSESNELARMDGNEAAADAAAKAESLLAQLNSEAPRYVTVRLASAILQRAVDRYREKNQGPVLTRASQIFAALTVGSFTGLRIDYDDDDAAPVLKGLRADNSLVGVAGMSDGSCDQLYLALRLATLEVWLESHEPIPFIVDDVLLQFDDERAAAALKALAELSRRTQVIFFTHHRHLVELAQKRLTGADLVCHVLAARGQ